MHDDKILRVIVRNTYGVERIYPACDTANIFTRLTGQKTFSHENIETIQQLGFKFIVVPQTVPSLEI